MIIALVLLLEPNILLSQIHWGVAPTWSQFLYGLAIGTVAYTGIETISNMAEEAQHPDKDVPRSINFVIIAVLVVYIGMPLAALSSMRVELQHGAGRTRRPARPCPCRWSPASPKARTGSSRTRAWSSTCPLETLENGTTVIPAQEPSGDVADGRRPAGDQAVRHPAGQQLRRRPGARHGALPAGQRRPGCAGSSARGSASWPATILFIATNAGLIGVSRLAFSLGQHRQLPRVLGRVHPTRLTPYVAIILFGIIAVILILPGEIPLLADLYAFGSMISFTAAHVSVIMLRYREPDLVRPFRAPLNVRIARHLRADDRRAGRDGHLRRVVRHRLLQARQRHHRPRLGRRWGSSPT